MNEKEFVKIVKPYIEAGRPGNWPHTQKVVKWVKKLGAERDDLDLIVRAAYVHDIGWKDLFNHNDKLTKDELYEAEIKAMKNTEGLAIEVLKKEAKLNNEEIKTVLKLIKAADHHHAENEQETILVDSDCLSKLNLEHLKDMYKEDEWMKMYERWFDKFPERLKTKRGKELYLEMFKNLKIEIEKYLK